jgi:hypothetical protein
VRALSDYGIKPIHITEIDLNQESNPSLFSRGIRKKLLVDAEEGKSYVCYKWSDGTITKPVEITGGRIKG